MISEFCNPVGLICPKFFNYHEIIQRGLLDKGLDVVMFDERPSNSFVMKSLLRLGCQSVVSSIIRTHYEIILDGIIEKDISKLLIINPECIPAWFLKDLKRRGITTTLYMWDSFDNKKYAKKLLPLVNNVYSFDLNDCEDFEGVNHLPLFFDESLLSVESSNQSANYDLSFVGTLHSDRYQLIKNIEKQAKDNGLSVYIYIYFPSRTLFLIRKFFDPKFWFVDIHDISFKSLSFYDYTKVLNSTGAMLDIQHPKQKGLTMRAVECFGSHKKIITTDGSINAYDFFNDENISIIDRETPILDLDLIKRPYVFPCKSIYNKYSLNSWLDTLLST